MASAIGLAEQHLLQLGEAPDVEIAFPRLTLLQTE